ncbi:MAG: L,D-transpeptidase family protein [Rhodothermaceae bacterium]|nr:L,D-transpeptidase family protein [Rhodothermaceae bacterium]
MKPRLFIALLMVACLVAPARAQGRAASVQPGGGERSAFERPADPAEAPVFYVVEAGARVYAEPDASSRSSARLDLREGVRVLAEEGDWSLIERNNRRGYVWSAHLSNIWIRVDKSDRELYVYRGAELIRTFPVDVSASDEDKERRSRRGVLDEYRIPEGEFFIARHNPNSRYYRALLISYPNRAHARRGLRQGLISEAQYEAIARAERNFEVPPMGTALGGLIEIHGQGSGRQRAWTRGCIALRNVHMDELWDLVHVGAPIIIEP